MANLKDIKYVDCASNELQVVRARYDFAVDGGASGAKVVAEATGDVVLVDCWVDVVTGLSSAGGITVSLGKTSATTGLLSASASTNFTAGACVQTTDATTPLKIADGEQVIMTLNTADATAGKMDVVMVFAQF